MKSENELLIIGIDHEIKRCKEEINIMLKEIKDLLNHPLKFENHYQEIGKFFNDLNSLKDLKRSKQALYDIDSDTNFTSDDIPF